LAEGLVSLAQLCRSKLSILEPGKAVWFGNARNEFIVVVGVDAIEKRKIFGTDFNSKCRKS
jgi:hypothetical protein